MKQDFGFPELEELRQIMVADLIPFSRDSRNLREISDISLELNKGLEIDISQHEIVGGLYSFKREQLVVHIYETYKEKEYVFNLFCIEFCYFLIHYLLIVAVVYFFRLLMFVSF